MTNLVIKYILFLQIIVKMNTNSREVELTVDQTTQTQTYDGLASVMHADSNIYLGESKSKPS